MGYSRDARMRMVPLNGLAETLNLMTAFSDAGGPISIREDWELDANPRSNINRALRSRLFGFRYRADMRFQIATMADTTYIQQLASRAASTDWTMFLSPDGGTTEYEVILRDFDGPRALGGKTFIGAEYRMRWDGVELLDEPPTLSQAAPASAAAPPVGLRGTSLPASGYPGQHFVLIQGPGQGDQIYIWAKGSDDAFGWKFVVEAG